MKEKKKIVVIIGIIIAVICVTICILTIWKLHSKKGELNELNTSTQVSLNDTENMDEYLQYNGKRYKLKKGMKYYLFMGIDQNTDDEFGQGFGSGGQADALFLLLEDTSSMKLKVLSIHRNSIVDVDVYNENDELVGTQLLQICLQHAYGDGKRVSCMRQVDCVSKMLYDLPIDGYVALNMDGIQIMNDAVGGVEVEVLQDVTWPELNVNLKQGETKRLSGNEAYAYVRKRDITEFDSASARLERQNQYILALLDKLGKMVKTNKQEALEAYTKVEPYVETNCIMSELMLEMQDYTFDGEMIMLPGQTMQGEKYEEYILDDEGVYETVINTFYEEVK